MPFFKPKLSGVLDDFYSYELKSNEFTLLYLDYSGILLRFPDKVLGFDLAGLIKPDECKNLKRLDLVLYTHSHYDHYDERLAVKVYEMTNAKIIAEGSVYRSLRNYVPLGDAYEAPVDDSITVADCKIRAIRGKHIGPIVLYLVEIKDKRIFHGADSSYVDLTRYRADIAMVPTGRPSPTASPNDAFKMVLDLKPKIAIAFHGSPSEHKEFEKLVSHKALPTRVIIPEKLKPIKIAL